MDSKRRRKLGLCIAVTVFVLSLACGQVNPGDQRLRPPIANFGDMLDDFFEWISLVRQGYVRPPWIDAPLSGEITQETSVQVTGWASTEGYSILPPGETPTVTLYRVQQFDGGPREWLAEAEVNEDHHWSATVPLIEGRNLIMAVVSDSKRTSEQSNVVVVYHGLPPDAPVITAPADGMRTVKKLINISGTGQAGSRIVLKHAERPKFEGETKVGEKGNWTIKGIKLGRGENHFTATAISDLDMESEPSKPVMVRRFLFRWPYSSHQIGGISCWAHQGSKHIQYPALDITAEEGNPILASEVGVLHLIEKSRNYPAAGNSIVIEHKNVDGTTYYTHYNHVMDFSREEKSRNGQRVERGDVIGRVGRTGKGVTGPHIHFEIITGTIKTLDGASEPTYNDATRLNINPDFTEPPQRFYISQEQWSDLRGVGSQLLGFPWDRFK